MKRGSPWTAPAMPDIRAALRRGFVELIERHGTALVDDPDLRNVRNPAQLRRRNALARELAASLDEMRTEVQAIDRAALYWVAREMVPVVMSAAQTLPEWTPDLVLPSDAGMLCCAGPSRQATCRFTAKARCHGTGPGGGGALMGCCRSRSLPG